MALSEIEEGNGARGLVVGGVSAQDSLDSLVILSGEIEGSVHSVTGLIVMLRTDGGLCGGERDVLARSFRCEKISEESNSSNRRHRSEEYRLESTSYWDGRVLEDSEGSEHCLPYISIDWMNSLS